MNAALVATDARVIAWAEARRRDVLHREFGRSLLTVGPDKPLGGRRFDSPLALFAWAVRFRLTRRRRGLDGFIEPTSTGAWAYVWHVGGLIKVLNRHLDAQQDAGWVQEGDTLRDLVQHIRREPVRPKTPLFDMIADAYGDKTGPGRTDVMPGFDPHLLLDAYQLRFGEPDPSEVFVRVAWPPFNP